VVVYDRAASSLAEITPGTIPWSEVFADAGWFHWTGITPAVSRGASECVAEALEAAAAAGVTVSVDLNYRAKLWKWGRAAREVMPDLVARCDYIIGNEEDAEKVFGIRGRHADVTAGEVDARDYAEVADALLERFARARGVAITLRSSLGASHNRWSAIFKDRGAFHRAAEYDILPIVDRVGGGDAFAAGLVYGLHAYADDPRKAVEFATAASCLKHSIPGDFNLVSVAEVEKLAGGDRSGRVAR
jgi:2-dehydro-3-deoxygluconokinase